VRLRARRAARRVPAIGEGGPVALGRATVGGWGHGRSPDRWGWDRAGIVRFRLNFVDMPQRERRISPPAYRVAPGPLVSRGGSGAPIRGTRPPARTTRSSEFLSANPPPDRPIARRVGIARSVPADPRGSPGSPASAAGSHPFPTTVLDPDAGISPPVRPDERRRCNFRLIRRKSLAGLTRKDPSYVAAVHRSHVR